VSHARWLGRGPHENYVDRSEGALLGVHEAAVDELHVPYIFPQENGHRTETRWLMLTSGGGTGGGLKVTAARQTVSFGFNASRHTTAKLAAAQHTCDLTAGASVELCVDYAMMGVGGDSAAMQTVKDAYVLKPEGGKCSWTVAIEALANSNGATVQTI